MAVTTISVDEFLRRNANSHITIEFIKNMNEGEEIDMLCIDRNFYDDLPMTSSDAETFFRKKTLLRVTKGLRGINATCHWLKPGNGGGRDITDWHTTFHIEYRPNRWYPLTEDHRLPQSDPQGLANFGNRSGLHWSRFPETTRLGWRGPMIPYEKVLECKENLIL